MMNLFFFRDSVKFFRFSYDGNQFPEWGSWFFEWGIRFPELGSRFPKWGSWFPNGMGYQVPQMRYNFFILRVRAQLLEETSLETSLFFQEKLFLLLLFLTISRLKFNILNHGETQNLP